MTNSSLCSRKNALTSFSLVMPLMKNYSQALCLCLNEPSLRLSLSEHSVTPAFHFRAR